MLTLINMRFRQIRDCTGNDYTRSCAQYGREGLLAPAVEDVNCGNGKYRCNTRCANRSNPRSTAGTKKRLWRCRSGPGPANLSSELVDGDNRQHKYRQQPPGDLTALIAVNLTLSASLLSAYMLTIIPCHLQRAIIGSLRIAQGIDIPFKFSCEDFNMNFLVAYDSPGKVGPPEVFRSDFQHPCPFKADFLVLRVYYQNISGKQHCCHCQGQDYAAGKHIDVSFHRHSPSKRNYSIIQCVFSFSFLN